ncbi:MAG TPA: FUSC family protein, partial [Myxococcales bacterium]|nr:FUSC family protein [Myxococcales bacterium]
MRAATATILPVLAGELSGRPVFLWMALGGWLASIADPGGPYRTRAIHLLGFLAGALAVTVVGSLAAGHPLIGPAVLFAGVLLCGFARALGDAAGTVGVLVLVLLCVALGAVPAPLPVLAVRAELVAAGALGAILLALGLWPLRPYLPVRRAVAGCYYLLAEYVRGMLALAGESEQAWDSLGRRERAQIRDRLERARHQLLAARGLRESDTPRGEMLLGLHQIAELALGGLSAASETLRTIPAHAADEERQALAALSTALAAVAWSTEGGSPPLDPAPLDRGRRSLRHAEVPGDLRAILDRLLAHGLVALEMAEALREGRTSPRDLGGQPPTALAARPLTLLRAELTPRSLVLRHALRVAITAVAGQLLAQFLQLPRSYWVTLTVVIVMQPQSGASFRRGLQRVLGTVAGGTLAALIGAAVHQPLALALVLFPLTAAAVALLPVNYGLYSTLLTPVFVLMSESLNDDWHLTRIRIINTLLGGAVALCSAWLLWPSWESQRRPPLLHALLESLRAYLRAVTARRPQPELLAARRSLGLAVSQVEASLQRAFSEPGATDAELGPLLALVAVARRFAGTTTVLDETLGGEAGPGMSAADAAT